LDFFPEEHQRGYLYAPGEWRPGGQPLAQSAGATAPIRPQKRSQSRVSAAVLGWHTQRRLLRADRLSSCWLHILVSGFGPPILMKLIGAKPALKNVYFMKSVKLCMC